MAELHHNGGNLEQNTGLPDSPELLRALIGAAPLAVFALQADATVTMWNKAAERIFGWSADEVLGKPLPIIPPEDQQALQAMLEEVHVGQAVTNREAQRMAKDGRRIDVSISTAPLQDSAGVTHGVVALVTDISQQKAAQAQIEYQARLVDSVSDTIFSTDLAFRIQTWNRAAELLYGWSAEEAIGQVSRELLGTGYGAVTRAEVDEALAEQGEWRGESVQVRRDGSLLYVQSSITVIRGSDGQATGYVLVNRDDTARKAAEAEVRRLNQELEARVRERTAQLEASNRELEAFAYSVSHDLRAPLRGVDGFSAVLAREYGDKLDEAGHHYLERIRAGVQRMGALIDGLLDLSRLTRRELRLAEVDLSLLAQEVAAALQAQEPERAVQVVIAPGLRARADPNLVRAVLENLLGNAWKFTGPVTQPRIEFGAQAGDPQSGGPGSSQAGSGEAETVYFVADNGVGFDMTYADKLFGPFQRLHRESEFPGSGIGLASVQRIVHRHGGRIWAQAAEGQGATFFFTLESQSGEII